MKTIFSISDYVLYSDTTIPEAKEMYNETFKEQGFILDEREQMCYLELDRGVKLNKGDIVDIYDLYEVKHVSYNPILDCITYELIQI